VSTPVRGSRPARPGRRQASALLIAYNGVVTARSGEAVAEIERRAALAPGTLDDTAFAPERYAPALLGRISRAAWRESVAAAILDEVGDLDTAERTVEEWDARRVTPEPQVAALVGDLRTRGVPVGLCVSALDVPGGDDVFGSGFDAVVGAAELGCVVPHPDFFTAACLAVRTVPRDCLYVDTSARNVAGARAAGLLGYRFPDPDAVDEGIRYLRTAFAV
jgi:putative hydrolase of the HAD superfamily